MTPFFSIIIPTLNEELFIPSLLNDLQNQKLKNFEIIIIDAKSKDKTKKVVKEYNKKLNLHFYQTSKKNVSNQKNYGAKKAKGKYLLFIDADHRIGKFFIKKLFNVISKKKDLIFIPAIIPEEKSSQTNIAYQVINYLVDMSQNTNKPLSSGGCMIFERHFFYHIGGFDENLFISEDHNIIQRSRKYGVKAVFLSNIKRIDSFRRINKEGKLKSLYKVSVGVLHTLFKGDIRKKIFDYEMGGHLYNHEDIKNKKTSFDDFDFIKFKKQIKKIILDTES